MSDNALLEISFMLRLSCEELMYVLTCASEIPMASEAGFLAKHNIHFSLQSCNNMKPVGQL